MGWGGSSWVWVKAAVLGTPLIPAAMGGTDGAGTRAGPVGQVRLWGCSVWQRCKVPRQRGAGQGERLWR